MPKRILHIDAEEYNQLLQAARAAHAYLDFLIDHLTSQGKAIAEDTIEIYYQLHKALATKETK